MERNNNNSLPKGALPPVRVLRALFEQSLPYGVREQRGLSSCLSEGKSRE